MKRMVMMAAMAVAPGCGGGSDNPDAGPIDAAVTRGTMSLAWSLTDLDDNPITCEDVGALSISVTVTPPGFGGVVEPFSCAGGMGTTSDLRATTYNVVVIPSSVLGALSESILIDSVEVVAGQNVDLGTLVFEIDPVGSFNFKVDTGATAGNCDDEGAGGGALTALEFRLVDDQDICVPTTFIIGDTSATPPVTYEADCQGATIGCFEKDVVFSVLDTRSGPHTLEITGTKNGLDCYARSSIISIPGNSLGRMLGNQILSLASTPECDPNAPDAGPMPVDAGSPDAP
jgi:hypothetical protein